VLVKQDNRESSLNLEQPPLLYAGGDVYLPLRNREGRIINESKSGDLPF